jgi:hypothetical protein
MATIKVKRGTTDPTSLQAGEPAFNTSANKLFVGNGSADKWVGAEIEASPGDWTSTTKLATQSAVNTTFMPKGGGTFTGAVSFGQGSTAAGEIRLLEDTDDGSNYSAFRGSARAANITYVMPTTDPTSGQILSAAAPSSNVSQLSWADASSATTVTTTSDNTNTTRYLVFSTTAGSGKTLYVDDTTTPLGYNPSTSTITVNNINSVTDDTALTFTSTGSDTSASFVLTGSPAPASTATTTASTINLNGAIATNGSSFELPATYTFGDTATAASTLNIQTGATAAATTKTINLGTGGAASSTTNVNIGSTNGGTVTFNSNAVAAGDLAVNGGDITTTAGVATIFSTNAATCSIGSASTALTIGYNSTAASTTNISIGAVGSGNTKTVNIGTGGAAGSTTNVNIGSANGGTVTVNSDAVITGNLTVNGTTTTVNSTTLTIDDKNIVLGNDNTLDSAADGGGITLNGASAKTFNWVDATDAWTSSEHLDLASGKSYYINGTSVLSSTTLGSGVTASSLTSLGTISTGVWNGTAVGAAYGGTGQTTYTTGDILYASGATAISKLSSSSTAGAVLASTGSASAPEYKTISFTNGSVTSGSGTLTLAVQDAAADGTTKGIATFNSTDFNSASGVITIDTVDGGTY